jgi:2-polyprenyl-3-methyl-5-hydroxy-6-metoxy-1,4-benzoquinol methylase
MITPEEVIYAYKLFLGREPESAEVIAGYCQNVHTLDQLSRTFMSSPEFMRRMGGALEKPQVNRHRHPFNMPKIPVETQVSAEVLEQMFKRVQKQWDHLGATEPYWSIVTQPQNQMAQFDQHREQFYASGNGACQTFLASLRRCGINPAQFNTCLEVGSGVGRVTSYLAEAFTKVIATDISGKHLELAKAHLAEQGKQNVELQHWLALDQMGELSLMDIIYSIITLQHNPPPVMAWMLSSLLSKLRVGGVAYLQIPTYKNGYLFEAERYLASKSPDTLEMHYLPQPDIFRLIADASCVCLEVREDGMVADEDTALSITFLVQKNLDSSC